LLPADLSTVCPVCAGSNARTLDQPSDSAAPSSSDAAVSPLQLRPGSILSGFEILEELNRGGMGVIYKARQQGLNRLVALKVIAPDRLGHPDAMRRFRREVQAAALLSHPNIVTVFHTDLDGPWPFLAMEYVPGIDLLRLVKHVGPLPMEDACTYIQQAAHGLQHAFEQGLVHRDIKPANLMVTPSPLDVAVSATRRMPRVKILDMGLARVMVAPEARPEISSLTQDGEFLGTPDYIAPEQAEDSRRADIRSDLYGLGGTLYFLVTGQVPFAGANVMQRLRRQLTEPAPSVRRCRPELPLALDSLVQRLMDREPLQRFQTPATLIDALDAFLRNPNATILQPAVASAMPREPSSQAAVKQVRAHPGGVQVLSLSPDGLVLLSGGLDETLRLWDAGRLREVRRIESDVGPVEDACLAPGGKWAASCALRLIRSDMVVQLWDVATGKERRRLGGHTNSVTCVAISPDGRRVAAGSADHTLRIWSMDPVNSQSLCLKGHTDQVNCLLFLPAGDAILSAGQDGTVRLWDAKTGGMKGSMSGQVGKVGAVAFGGASKRIAIAGEGLQVRQANGVFTPLSGHDGQVLSVAFSANGKHVVSGGSDGTVRIWRAEDGEELHCLEGHNDKVRAVAFNPDGLVAYSGSADGTLRRWPLGG
jgi:serine/threonine protein kinase